MAEGEKKIKRLLWAAAGLLVSGMIFVACTSTVEPFVEPNFS
jgi:hypothetical protein